MEVNMNKKDDIIMKLIHYFVTIENYKPIVVNGLKNEVWLENMNNDFKIIRINGNYLHNNEQFNKDFMKTDIIRKNIKKKTYSLKMKLLNICIDLGDYVDVINSDDIIVVSGNKITDIKKSKVINDFFPCLKDNVLTKKNDEEGIIKMTNELNKKTEREDKKYMKLFSKNIPFITYTLIAINLLLFVLMFEKGLYASLINNFANYYINVRNGEYYRLISSAFLHVDVMHILFNMYALYILGPTVEKYFGKIKFILIYIVSAVVGGLFSCALVSNHSIGASGAIFGLMGALLYFGMNYRATMDRYVRTQLVPLILMNLIIGFMVPNIDVWCHVGGFIGGYLISLAFGDATKKGVDNIHGIIMLLILVVSLVVFVSMRGVS